MTASSASALAEPHDEILALEEDTWRALQKSGADMIPYIAPDCIFQFPMDMKLTPTSRPSVVDVLHSPAFVPWKKFELSKVDVQSVGKGGAAISYFARAIRPAAASAERSRDEERDVPFQALFECLEVGEWQVDDVFSSADAGVVMGGGIRRRHWGTRLQ
ncbi:hypothetical protein Tdes44962_MAKER06501 [Teratosphaeria destructans]|uniref:DUF4440 domain-containing protein n=1 Tax=Teratosphaeria destructans TaxID=418781 RepID=A0A9W7T1Z9_9PEZI|nr:hypothetical protein Tdes44962_MAKER06501 [Teratosphaeria destructans]